MRQKESGLVTPRAHYISLQERWEADTSSMEMQNTFKEMVCHHLLSDKLPQHLMAQNNHLLLFLTAGESWEDKGNSSALSHVNRAAVLCGQTKQKYPRRRTPQLAVDAGCWLRCQLESLGSPLRGLSKKLGLPSHSGAAGF